MRLHRYFGSRADITLSERRLLLNRASSFNDPFEFVHRFIGDYTLESAVEDIRTFIPERMARELANKFDNLLSTNDATRQKPFALHEQLAKFAVDQGIRPLIDPAHCHELADKYFRLCCFSKCDVDPDAEILLWSHYANKHAGVRIEYELDSNELPLFEVNYSQERCAIDLSMAYSEDQTNEVLKLALRTKSLGWKYENEVRLIIYKEHAIKKPIPLSYRYYLQFDPGSVKSVDFGINCPPGTINQVRAILDADYPNVRMRKAVHHPDDFAIEFRPIT
ncbi:MAG: DUF2971 domain-containing protein [Verrucomicrobia bacterium]|nr:DUF2971 domain-containing protein [Verrucomicrobiota bacterium]